MRRKKGIIVFALVCMCLFVFNGCKKSAVEAGVVATEKVTEEEGTTKQKSEDKEVEKTINEKVVLEDLAGTPVEKHGELYVQGTQLVDSDSKPYQLRGVSTHGLSWFPQYANGGAFETMKDEWGINAIRLAMYTEEYNGYCVGDNANKTNLKNLIYSSVDSATDLGLYVMIDWHILSDNNPNSHKEEAIAFFDEISQKYKDNSNVIYEICNEPNSGTSWSQIKSYAEEVIPVIKANNKDAIIIVGTPTWSQDVDKAAEDPITGYSNIMYALHFYADTHKESLRNKMVAAIEKGIPIFVSEYGICDASGNGAINETEANKWVEIMNQYGVSYMAWNLSNKNESSSLISSGSTKTSGWGESDLSASGKWLVNMLGNKVTLEPTTISTESTTKAGQQTQEKNSGQGITATNGTEIDINYDIINGNILKNKGFNWLKY